MGHFADLERRALVSSPLVTHFLNIWFDLNNANVSDTAKQHNTDGGKKACPARPWGPVPDLCNPG